jgi:fucose permease
MHIQFDVPLSSAGIVAMLISGGTIISSLMSAKITKRLGTGLITTLSVFITALALFGFSISTHFYMLCIWAIPYGLGAGAIDAALNNYVALHYSSRHMNWLHCFWGVGTIISPYIMSYFLTQNSDWNGGYKFVSFIQIAITLILLICLPLWKKAHPITYHDEKKSNTLSLKEAFKIKGVKEILIGFFSYCAAEGTVMLWVSSYLVEAKKITAETAAAFASFFFIGITVGRFISGIISNKISDKKLIQIGTGIIILGIIFISIPVKISTPALLGFVIMGLGCAPIYPAIIHSTPKNFGKENSQSIIGIQMASAYVGSTFIPPIFGLIANYININLLSIFLMFFVVLMFIMTQKVNKYTQTEQ